MIRAVLLSVMVVAGSALDTVRAQKKPGDSPIAKIGREDPYTDKDEKLMKELGVVSYAPITWADGLRSSDIEKVLGEERFLWLETEHFRIVSNFGYCGPPTDPKARKFVNEEMTALNKKFHKLPARKSKIDPWHRLHLYAFRAETLYADFAQLIGHTDPATHLGNKEKFCLAFFQKKSDLARYLDKFCNVKSEQTQRYYHYKSKTYSLAMTAEGSDGPYSEATLYAQFRLFLMEVFVDAAGGGPMWLTYGLGHCYERDIPCNMINCGIHADESVDRDTQYDWERKMERRSEHEELLIPFLELTNAADLGYYAHLQSWARVDYLRQDREKFGQFVRMLLKKHNKEQQIAALAAVYSMTPEEFDADWRKWVQKVYK